MSIVYGRIRSLSALRMPLRSSLGEIAFELRYMNRASSALSSTRCTSVPNGTAAAYVSTIRAKRWRTISMGGGSHRSELRCARAAGQPPSPIGQPLAAAQVHAPHLDNNFCLRGDTGRGIGG